MIITPSMQADAHGSAGAMRGAAPPPSPRVGERIELRIVRQLGERRYLARFGDREHIVDSSVELAVGSHVQAAVVSVGEQLQLRYAGMRADEVAGEAAVTERPAGRVLTALERRFAVKLSATERETAEQAMASVGDPAAMAAGALFLNKQSLPVHDESLQAIYQAQTWRPATVAASGMSTHRDEDAQRIAQRMTQALQGDVTRRSTAAAAAYPHENSTNERGRDPSAQEHSRERARELLNIHNDGSVHYRYGVLPMLLGDQLVELDLAHFQQGRDEASTTGGMRRMIMTFTTRALGHIEVTAQSLAENLNITIRSDSALSNEVLKAHAADVTELAARLGWRVDHVRYEADSGIQPAAAHVVDHVLHSELLSVLL